MFCNINRFTVVIVVKTGYIVYLTVVSFYPIFYMIIAGEREVKTRESII